MTQLDNARTDARGVIERSSEQSRGFKTANLANLISGGDSAPKIVHFYEKEPTVTLFSLAFCPAPRAGWEKR